MSRLASQSGTSPRNETIILRAGALRKSFQMGESSLEVLKGADLAVRGGEFVAIEGRSGSGKSTLLHLLGALDAPDAGSVIYDRQDIAAIDSTARCRLRNTQFGFVFQFYYLLPELDVLENTLLAAMVEHGWFGFRARKKELQARATHVLESLGMGHRLRHKPNQLSGGERQRVAIARARMNNPKVLFADEPTGNLDADTGRQIMSVLESLHKNHGQTIVMVTHDRTMARQADRILVLKDGKLERADEKSP